MVFFRLRLVEGLQIIELELFLPQKYDQLSVGVSGGVYTSGVRAPLKVWAISIY